MKTCSKCGIEKDDDQFGRRKNGRLRMPCKACCTAYTAEYVRLHPKETAQYFATYIAKKRSDPNWVRANSLRRYDLTPEQYDNLVEKQNGLCAICWQPKRLFVDHHHPSNTFRELLCSECNTAIGLAYENCTILESMKQYLRKHTLDCKLAEPFINRYAI